MDRSVTWVPLSTVAVAKGLIGGPFGSSLGRKDYQPDGIPVIRGQNLSGDRPFCTDDFVYVSLEKAQGLLHRNLAQPDDVIFTQRGTLGQVGLVPSEPYETYVISQSQMRLRTDPSKADARYVYYCFRDPTMVDAIQRRATATGVPHINLATLADIEIPLRPLPQQCAIAEVLGALDDKIGANTQMRDLCASFLAASFEHLAAPGLLHARDGRSLPAGWQRTSLGTALDVLETGRRPRGGVAEFSEGIPSLGAESVLGLALYNFAKTKYVPLEFFRQMKRGWVEDRDVLLYKDGGRPGEYEPHVAMLGGGFPYDVFCINEHVYRLRATSPLTQEYLYCWLNSEPLLQAMRRSGTGVAIPGLNSTAVKALPVVVPPVSVLRSFTWVAEPLVAKALTVARESQALATLRDALLPKLLSGELRVRDAENLAEEAI
jgi:type I restriction enzyme S subunit